MTIDERDMPKGWSSSHWMQQEAVRVARLDERSLDQKDIIRRAYKSLRYLAEQVKNGEAEEIMCLGAADVVWEMLLFGSVCERDIGVLVRRNMTIVENDVGTAQED